MRRVPAGLRPRRRRRVELDPVQPGRPRRDRPGLEPAGAWTHRSYAANRVGPGSRRPRGGFGLVSYGHRLLVSRITEVGTRWSTTDDTRRGAKTVPTTG